MFTLTDKSAAVLDSLSYEEEEYRLRSIESAHDTTCAWIFENRRLGFMDWILNGEGIYWIRGKPGSGKSTLFRYLHDNDQFQEMLSSRNLETQHVDVWYFFNERGTYLQKSLEGLLRGLLRRIVSSNDVFAKLIMDFYYAKPRETRGYWTMDDIKAAFAAILVQDVAPVELTIFLDALDEYFGFPETIVRWIQDCLARAQVSHSCTSLRFCISSREYDAFVREFSGAPGFSLHMQTQGDIKEYLHSRLADLLSRNEGMASISPAVVIDILSDRAQGVFLWVKLALDELATLPGNAGATEAIMLIDKLPADLEDFYKRTISRIPLHARSRAYALLELVHKTPYLLRLDRILEMEACAGGATFEICHDLLLRHQQRMTAMANGSVHSETGQLVPENVSDGHIARDSERKIQQLTAEKAQNLVDLCGGLLDCSELKDPDDLERFVQGEEGHFFVGFIHQTVRDFVGRSEFASIILGRRHLLQTENGYSLAFKHQCVENDFTDNPDELLIGLAQAHERTTGRASAKFLDSLPSRFFEQPDPAGMYAPAGYTSKFLLGVVAGLLLYIQPYLRPERLQATRTDNPQAINVLAWNVARRGDPNFASEFESLDTDAPSSPDMLKTLIAHGFSGTADFFGLSPFETIFCRSFPGSYRSYTSEHSPEMIQFAEILIQRAGQDPSVSLRSREGRYVKDIGFQWKSGMLSSWSAVHVSHSDMMAMLLRNGANPNVQDSKGNTALDGWIGGAGDLFWTSDYALPEEAYYTTMMLLDHGAKLTRRGAILRPVFLEFASRTYGVYLSRLNEVDVLDLPVDTSDIDLYSRFPLDPQYISIESNDNDLTSQSPPGDLVV